MRLLAPDDDSRANYLTRMRLGAVITALGGDHDLPYVREHENVGDFLELTQFTGARGAERLAEMLLDKVIDDVGQDVASGLFRAVCEVGQNVPHHAKRQTGFIAAQTTNSGRRVQFAIADAGVGMLPGLVQKGAGSDAVAIKMAVEQGISETGERHRGVGLRETRRLACTSGGNLHVLSGSAAVTYYGRRVTTTERADHGFAGTLVQGTFVLGS